MAANTNPIFEKLPNSTGVQLVNASGTTKQTLITADATNGTRVDAINISSTDTATVVVNFYVTIGGTDYFRGSVSVATLTGTLGAVTVEAVAILAAALGYISLPPGSTLKCAANAAVTAAKTVDVVTSHGDY